MTIFHTNSYIPTYTERVNVFIIIFPWNNNNTIATQHLTQHTPISADGAVGVRSL